MIVVSNRPAHRALTTYKKRWAIENLFGDTKTRGLNIEDTRLFTGQVSTFGLSIGRCEWVISGNFVSDGGPDCPLNS